MRANSMRLRLCRPDQPQKVAENCQMGLRGSAESTNYLILWRSLLEGAERSGMGETRFVFEDGRVRPKVGVPLVHPKYLSAFGVALTRRELGGLVQRAVTEDFDRFLGREFTARDLVVHRLRLRSERGRRSSRCDLSDVPFET